MKKIKFNFMFSLRLKVKFIKQTRLIIFLLLSNYLNQKFNFLNALMVKKIRI